MNMHSFSAARESISHMETTEAKLSTSLGRLSSGLKLKIDEDAGGLAVSSKLDSTISRSAAIAKNLQNGLSFLESQDASESRLGAIITRMSELRHRYDDLTLNLGDRHGLNREFKELKEEIKSIAQRKFNGISLFSNQSDTQSKLIVNTASGTQPTLAQISRNLFFNSILDTNATAGPIGANLTVQGSTGSFAGTTVTPTGGNTPNQTVNGAAGSTPAETFKGVQGSTPSQTVAGGIPGHSPSKPPRLYKVRPESKRSTAELQARPPTKPSTVPAAAFRTKPSLLCLQATSWALDQVTIRPKPRRRLPSGERTEARWQVLPPSGPMVKST